ncbi:MAG: stalk domain-containing protein [bacterium]|nr:stalk domain-containing protein [bacterium]
MKKLLCTLLAAAAIAAGTKAAFAEGAIPDHRGTPMTGIAIGTEALSRSVLQYGELFEMSGEQYGVDPNLLAAICMQESSGRNLSFRDDGTEYPAWGIMQIEYTLENAFADFGEQTTGVRWTLEDRLDPAKAVPFAAWLISESLYKYDCDYMKTIQAYNFGDYILDKIIEAKGDKWLDERKNAVSYVMNWEYKSYGDAEYIEHVMRYYHNNLSYRSAKVRLNGKLVKCENQAPIVENGRTLVPVRALSQTLGAKVEWDGESRCARISKGRDTIIIPADDTTAYINGEAARLDVPARILNGRTMVPLRFAAETFGLTVNWDENTRTVGLSGSP